MNLILFYGPVVHKARVHTKLALYRTLASNHSHTKFAILQCALFLTLNLIGLREQYEISETMHRMLARSNFEGQYISS